MLQTRICCSEKAISVFQRCSFFIAEKETDRFEVERSINNIDFYKTVTVTDRVLLHVQQQFSATDDISNSSSDVIYYRLKVIGKAGEIKYSNIIVLRISKYKSEITISPNPASNFVIVKIVAVKDAEATLILYDNSGKAMLKQQHKISKGNNTIILADLNKYGNGVFEFELLMNEEVFIKKLVLRK